LTRACGIFSGIIVDDGSTDRTPELLAELAASDPRLRVLSPGRLGSARALNLAIKHARGAHIANQDFDDQSYPERPSLQTAFLDANPKIGVLGCGYVLIDKTGGESYKRLPPTDHDQIVRAMASRIPLAPSPRSARRRGGRPAVIR
jgi:glycosyltransferase EpsE